MLFAADSMFDSWTLNQVSSIAVSRSSTVLNCDSRFARIVLSMAARTAKPMIESNTTAMIGQIHICRRKKSPAREIERPTVLVPNVMCGPRCWLL
jgi:hypothetical protein